MDGCEILDLAFAKIIDPLIVGFALSAAIPADVVINSVIVTLAVSPVVFLVVCRQVIQGEAVMSSNEVDAVRWFVVTTLIKIGTACDSSCNFTNDSWLPLDEIPDAISVFSIPLGPTSSRKGADLVQASSIPSLSDHFGLTEQIVEFNRPDDWRMLQWNSIFPST